MINFSAIASHLNIAATAITEVQLWANVIWVKFIGGCRFVSKKVGFAKMNAQSMVDKINSELVRLGKGGIEGTYSTYAEIDSGFIRIHDYTSQLDGRYLDGNATVENLQKLNTDDFKTWFDQYKLIDAMVKGEVPQYVKDLCDSLSVSVNEYV
jgi:hypothetical protein